VDPILEELSDKIKDVGGRVESIESKISSPDCPKETLEEFDGLTAQYEELTTKYRQREAEVTTSEDVNDRVKRARDIADATKKFQQDTFRNPNWNRNQQTRQLATYVDRPERHCADMGMAVAAWAMGFDPRAIDAEQIEACKRLGVNPAEKRFAPAQAMQRVEQYRISEEVLKMRGFGRASFSGEGFSTALGYADSRDETVLALTNRAPTFVATIATNMITYGGIMQSPISIETVGDYEDIIETYTNDQVVGRQIGEGQTIGANQNPTSGQITWKNWDYTSDDVTISQRQLRRTRMELPSWVSDQLGERLGRRISKDLSNGTGATQPYGIVAAAIAGARSVASLSAGAITYDDIHSSLTFGVDPVFRNNPGSGFMMSEDIMKYLMRIKDSYGRPMFNWGWEGGNKIRTLEGYPVFVNREMITTRATGDKPILFGDISKYKVVFRDSMIPTLIRDETTNRRVLTVIFTALVNFDAQLRNYGNCPLCYLQIA